MSAEFFFEQDEVHEHMLINHTFQENLCVLEGVCRVHNMVWWARRDFSSSSLQLTPFTHETCANTKKLREGLH